MTSAPRPRPRPRPIAPATALVVALLAAGCSGDEESGDAGPDLVEPSDPPTLAIEPVTDLGKVTGRIPRKDAKTVEQRVSRVAIDWLTDAYVGGSYPAGASTAPSPASAAGPAPPRSTTSRS